MRASRTDLGGMNGAYQGGEGTHVHVADDPDVLVNRDHLLDVLHKFRIHGDCSSSRRMGQIDEVETE